MRHLCDSNVILATVLERHPHHGSTLAWLNSLAEGDMVALCRQTQTSFLRLLTTEAVMKEEVQTNAAAIGILLELMADPRFEFVTAEPIEMEALWFKAAGVRQASPKKWMDAYLAAFARGHSLRFVTFDKAFEELRRGGLDLLVLS
jgi:toxin-antitoxin system PIN domain toxin